MDKPLGGVFERHLRRGGRLARAGELGQRGFDPRVQLVELGDQFLMARVEAVDHFAWRDRGCWHRGTRGGESPAGGAGERQALSEGYFGAPRRYALARSGRHDAICGHSAAKSAAITDYDGWAAGQGRVADRVAVRLLRIIKGCGISRPARRWAYCRHLAGRALK